MADNASLANKRDQSPSTRKNDRKHLFFTLGGRSYAVPVLSVSEISQYVEPTPVPKAPSHLAGVINLRGKVLPVIDLSVRLGFSSSEIQRKTCIVVFSSSDGNVGAIVDSVDGVGLLAKEGDSSEGKFVTSGERSTGIEAVAGEGGNLTIVLDVATITSQCS